MTAERLLNVRCQDSDQLAVGAKHCRGKERKREEERKKRKTESKKAKSVHGKAFKLLFYPKPEGQHITGLVQAVWSLPASHL